MHTTRILGFAVLTAALLQACAHGGSPASRLRQVDTALARGDTSRAIHLLRPMVESGGAAPERYAQMGRLHRSRNTIVDRLRAQQILERGLQRFPGHPAILMELGKTYYLQTFYPDAVHCFRRVLEKDDGNCEAHYYLGLNLYRKWRRVQVYREYLGEARGHLATAAACEPDNRDASYKLAFSSYVLGDSTQAIRVCEAMINRYQDAPEAWFLLAAIAFEHDEFELAVERFNTSLQSLPHEEGELYADIRLLLDEETLAEYELAAEGKRLDMTRVFWAERNPDPTAAVNVRYLEHLYRMTLADAFFRLEAPALRGWETERGKALVKFGRPRTIATTLQGEFLSGRKEIWKYGDGSFGFTFVFMDEFLNGNYMVPMDYRYSYIAQALNLGDPLTSYASPYEAVPGVLDVVSFRNPASTSVYLTLKIDMDSLVYHMNLQRADAFLSRTSFFDRDWRPTHRFEDTLGVDPVRRQSENGDPWYYLVEDYELPFDYHRVAFSLADDTHRGQALFQSQINTLSYLSDSLALSDILLQRDVDRRDPSGHPAVIQRAGRLLFPNPGGSYSESEKLRLYFEIYNLHAPGAGSRYDIIYSIFDATADSPRGWARIKRGLKFMAGFQSESDPVISQTLERKSIGHRADENLAIDIGALRAGDYVLTVTVRDKATTEIAQRSVPFTRETATNGR